MDDKIGDKRGKDSARDQDRKLPSAEHEPETGLDTEVEEEETSERVDDDEGGEDGSDEGRSLPGGSNTSP